MDKIYLVGIRCGGCEMGADQWYIYEKRVRAKDKKEAVEKYNMFQQRTDGEVEFEINDEYYNKFELIE